MSISLAFADAFDALNGEELARFPTLTRAAENITPAKSVKVEWIGEDGQIRSNFCQITRSQFSAKVPDGDFAFYDVPDELKDAMHAALLDLLTTIEHTLLHGEAREAKHQQGYPLRWCGGYREYLDRDLEPDDTLILRPVPNRELRLRYWQKPGGSFEGDWLSEFTLEVHAG